MNDARFAFRKLRQSPAFTFIAIVTLDMGIGPGFDEFGNARGRFFVVASSPWKR